MVVLGAKDNIVTEGLKTELILAEVLLNCLDRDSLTEDIILLWDKKKEKKNKNKVPSPFSLSSVKKGNPTQPGTLAQNVRPQTMLKYAARSV